MLHIVMVSIKELTLILDGGCQNSTYCCSICSTTVTHTLRLLSFPVHVLPSTQFSCSASTHLEQQLCPILNQLHTRVPSLLFLSLLDCSSLHVRHLLLCTQYRPTLILKIPIFSGPQRRRLTLSHMARSHFSKAIHILS